jgi:hypothetical protein
VVPRCAAWGTPPPTLGLLIIVALIASLDAVFLER